MYIRFILVKVSKYVKYLVLFGGFIKTENHTFKSLFNFCLSDQEKLQNFVHVELIKWGFEAAFGS